jgi:hypothetical protein
MPSSSPEGLIVGNPNKPWRIGKAIGSGACGSVHEIERVSASSKKGDATRYVAKIAPLPSGKRPTKKKKCEAERNADLLNHEISLYNNMFNDMRGNMVPDVPLIGSGHPPMSGEISGKPFVTSSKQI